MRRVWSCLLCLTTKSTPIVKKRTRLVFGLGENVESDPAARLPIAEAFQDYCAFCQAQRLTPPAMMAFFRQMGGRNLKTAGSRKGGRKISGIRLRPFGLGDLDDIG